MAIAKVTPQQPTTKTEVTRWNYRLVDHGSNLFAVHRTYYDAEGAVIGIEAEAESPAGKTERDVNLTLASILRRMPANLSKDCRAERYSTCCIAS